MIVFTETVNVCLERQIVNHLEETSTYARLQLIGSKEVVEFVKSLIQKNEEHQ